MGPQVLVIDDDAAVRETICDVLDEQGYRLLQASNGAEGLDLAGCYAPELVITDILMPDKEGIETIHELRERLPATKIIAMSGGGSTGNLDFLAVAAKMGVDSTLPKPFTPADLVVAVKELLRRPG